MRIETARLVLRQITAEDRPALAAILQDPITMTAYEGPFSDDEVDAWLARMIERYSRDGVGMWAVDLQATGEMIGQCGISLQDQAGRWVHEVGYLFNREHWHRGYATEAAAVSRDYGFANLPIETLFSHVRDTNIASMNVAIRIGMTVRSRFIKHYRGVEMPHYAFGVDRPL